MGPRQRQGRSRSKTHALPIILLSFLGFCLSRRGIWHRHGRQRQPLAVRSARLHRRQRVSGERAHRDRRLQRQQDCELLHAKPQVHHQGRGLPTCCRGTVDVEDERFYEHGGIDLWGIARAAVATLGGGHEGASTITQQLVRNTILQEEQFDSTIERKVREAYIAVKMEDMYSKDGSS